MQVNAKLRYLRQSPRKVRLVTQAIKGLDIQAAQNQLQFVNKKAANPILKLLNSAVANAENNFQLKRDNLYIKLIKVDQGPTLGRWTPRAFGRATPIKKKTSHISIILDEKVATLKADKKKKDKKSDQDVKIVKSLDEVKKGSVESEQADTIDKSQKLAKNKDYEPEAVDASMMGKDRGKQHLDQLRKKGKGGSLKRMFRRKSI